MFFFKTRHLVWLNLLCVQLMHAQIKSEYDQLNSSMISSGFWYPQALKQRVIPHGSSYDEVVSAKESASIYAAFFQACIDSSLNGYSYDEFRREMREEAINDKVVPISILDLKYHDFKPNCFEDNLLTVSNGKIVHVNGAIGSPFQEYECLALWVDMSHVLPGPINFVLRESLFLTNRDEMPNAIEIDFDDGQGFRVISFNEVVIVEYGDINSDKVIKLKLHRNDQTYAYASMKSIRNFRFFPCLTSPFPFPDLPPWPASSMGNWSIQTEYLGDLVYANAYTLYSDDQIFDKPFIFVEGVDFGVNDDGYPIQGEYQFGEFGWCEFSSGFFDPDNSDQFKYPYDNLKLMPELLHELRAYGYDLILLDFYDGADALRKNSEVLKHLISLCNEYKQSNESLVVAGASMGGQITRYALRTMELEGVDHCTRLWLSMDSPHQGANIPIAMQKAIEFLCSLGKEGAIIFRDKYLLRPAARQMLNDQVFSDLNLRDDWYNELNEIGYPENCKRVAITNGSLIGVSQDIWIEPLIKWQCGDNLIGDDQIVLNLHHQGGNANELNESGEKLLGHVKLPTVGADNISWTDWFTDLNLLDFYSAEEVKFWKTDQKPNWDYSAGGKRNSIEVLAESMNNELENYLLDFPCTVIQPIHYNKYHSFVSTSSSLGIDTENPTLNCKQFLVNNPPAARFDSFYGPDGVNEEHVEITEENSNFILGEVLSWEYSGLGSELTGNSINDGSFNYAKKSFTEIRDLYIYNHGQLNFNVSEFTHFNQLDDVLELPSLMKFSTPTCTPATIYIGDDGLVNVGDEFNSAYQAEVHIRRDSRLIVASGGTLRINEGSKIVIHEGAEITFEKGSTLELNNGRIEVLAGGVMNVFGEGMVPTVHAFKLNGNEACISFENGKLQLSDNVTLTFDTSVEQTGYFEILPGSENTLLTEVGSKLVFEGKDQDDVVLRINNYAHLQNANFATGSLVFKNCKVDLNNHGAIYTDMATFMDRANFVADEWDMNHSGSVVVWYSTCFVKNSRFKQVKLITKFSKLGVDESDFEGAKSGIDADNGAFEIKSSNFDLSSVRSEGLQYASLVENCIFDGGIDPQVSDKSLVELLVKNNLFAHASEYGIEKEGGKLSASCNAFNDVYGIKIIDGDLNMSANNGAGYNVFNQTPRCIELDNAATVDLKDGYNDFSGFEYYYIKGTINMSCGEDNCFPEINARGNCWGYASSEGSVGIPDTPIQPDQQFFDVHTTIVVPCGGYENSNACTVYFIDTSPVTPDACPDKVKLVVKKKNASHEKSEGNVQAKDNVQDISNPLLNTTTFQDVSLDSALVYSASMSEAYDSTGSDLLAVDLLHEILTSGLDFYNLDIRAKMNWARYVMKSSVERMFLREELNEDQNIVGFEFPVQQYVDVLNLMTDTALTDSTYLDQFYLELDKGQLFRTIGQRETALTIFEHLGDCQLDSLEQLILEQWRLRTEMELSVNDQYIVEDVPADSIMMSVDSAGHQVAFNLQVSDYYFGLWIDSPQSVTFVACGDDPVYRDLWSEEQVFGVFPNPSSTGVTISGLDGDSITECQLWDLTGRIIYSGKLNNENASLIWPEGIASGSYVLRILQSNAVEDHLLMISK